MDEKSRCSLLGGCKKFKPHLLMVSTQIGYTFLYFITEASFNHGMNPHVYITYRHIVAGLVMFPFAYFLERVGLTLNMYFASLRYTSPTFVASMVNTIASLTFIIAVALRFEVVDIGHPRGVAKVVGTLVSLGGVMTMTLYKGPLIQNLWHPLLQIHANTTSIATHENWLKGSILTVASCITWSIWYIMQGIVISGLIIFIQLWCTEEKGPVFVTMFNPVSTILVAILAYFVFGEKLHLGSIIGAVIVIVGLYLLLWGKEGDQGIPINNTKEQFQRTREDPESRT
ncbi:WAT1-related protein [Senna tora]|uniref:WAT1-related protein n=1 Tax=Senna tora TaxID=362788 RepID=A0A834SSY9_9FABA|nr:WAT1-related protein [Senna tora]